MSDPPPPPPSLPVRGKSVAAGYTAAVACWAVSVIPLGAAFLSLLCDVDGDCTRADTNQRRAGLAIAAFIWLVSGPVAMVAGGKRWLLLASLVPFVLTAPLVPYFIAGP